MTRHCGHARPAAGCHFCRLARRPEYAALFAGRTPDPGRTRSDAPPAARCASLGKRLEFRAGCASGAGCRHECGSNRADVLHHLGGVPQATPAEDCGPGRCPGYVARAPGLVTAADLAQITVPPPRSKLCVLTLAQGAKGRDLLAVSGPPLSDYAARVGADFRVIEPPDHSPLNVSYWKFAAKQFLLEYDRVMWADADARVASHCRNLFEFVPESHVGLYCELSDLGATSGYGWLYGEYERVQRSQGLPLVPPARSYNSGVWVASRRHAAAWEPPPRPFPLGRNGQPPWCCEQQWLTLELARLRVPVFHLPVTLNAQVWSLGKSDPAAFAAAEIRHWSGVRPHERRLAMMRAAAQAAGG